MVLTLQLCPVERYHTIRIIKLEDLPGCAVQVGSVGGHIECKDKYYF